MEILSIILIIYVIKHAVEDAKKGYGKSKAAYMASADKRFPSAPKSRRAATAMRHDIGYWSAQASRGFPSVRHGLAAGWHAGRREQAERKAGKEWAKAQHMEARARLAPDVAGYKERQQSAAEKLRAFTRRQPVNDTGGTCLYCDAPDGQECSPDCPYFNQDRREMDRIKRERAARADREGSAPEPAADAGAPRSSRRVDGKPETDADPHEHCNKPGCGCRCHATADNAPPAAEPEKAEPHVPPQSPQPEGETMPTGTTADVTYDGVTRSMAAEQVRAEARAAEQARAAAAAEAVAAEQQQAGRDASAAADAMQALKVDPGTLSAMADHLDAQDKAEKAQLGVHEANTEAVRALQHVQETAAAVEAALRAHAGLNQAHQEAPVVAADRTFYGEG
jgi:hypothetical protein